MNKIVKNNLLKMLSLTLIIILLVIGILITKYNPVIKLKNEKVEKNALQTVLKFKEMSVGIVTTLAIDNEGNLWAWGENDDRYGLFGDGTKKSSTTPIKVNISMKLDKISITDYHVLAIDTNGNLWAWGSGMEGQLGNGLKGTWSSCSTVPIQVKSGTKFKEVAAGKNHSIAIDTNGNLWGWGASEYDDNRYVSSSIVTNPVQIKSGTKFTKIVAGNCHSMAIDTSGNLWTWGDNYYGQLGNGTNEPSKDPIQVKSGTTFKEIAAGEQHSMAIDTSGNLWTWGINQYGQLGQASGDRVLNPTQQKSGTRFTSISAGGSGSFAIDTNNNLWCCRME